MKAAVLYGQEDLRYTDYETPKIKEDEVLIEVKASGICGSDVPRVLGTAAHYYPIILGHEFSGVIKEVGSHVDSNLIGKRATAAPLLPCGECDDCQKGNYSLCKHYKFIGSSVFGSYAEYVKVPVKNVVTFEDTVSFYQGVFFEPSTVALHGLKCANFHGGETVAILGCGTIGIFTLQWCKLLGAKKIVAFDINSKRLDLAKKLGADVTINTSEADFMDAAQKEVNGKGYPFVFETAGQNVTMSLALELAANKATACFIGTSSRDLTFNWKKFELINRKEMFLTGSWMSYSAPFPGDEWTKTAEYFSSGKLLFDDSLIDSIYDLSEAKQAFARFHEPKGVNGKIVISNIHE